MYHIEDECSRLIDKIQKMCVGRGWTRYTLAKKAGLSTSTVHALMSKKTKPQIYTLLQICNALEISVEELFDKKDFDMDIYENTMKNELTKEEAVIIDCYRNLSEEKKDWIRAGMGILQKEEGCYSVKENGTEEKI